MQEELVKKLNILSQQEDEGEASEKAKAAEAFKSFIGLIRDGKTISKQDITRNAKFFRDEFTIEHVSRAQLEAMCNFMGIPTYGGDNLLRFQIRHRPPLAPACSVSLFFCGRSTTPQHPSSCVPVSVRMIGYGRSRRTTVRFGGRALKALTMRT